MKELKEEDRAFWQQTFITWLQRGESTAVATQRADAAIDAYRKRIKEE